jgi:membrane-associated phospholipid phosphatase
MALPASPRLKLPLIAGGVLCLGLVALGTLGFRSRLIRLDLAVVEAVHRLSFEEATVLARGVTELASTTTVLSLGAASAAFMLLRGNWHGAVAVTVSVLATQAIVFGIKALVGRGRPPEASALVDAAGHAFPSAHAASGMALYGLLALIVMPHLRGRRRVAAAALAVGLVGALGLTRVYLGAHYPSDVVAGWLVGALVAAGAWQLGRTLRARLPQLAVAA